MDVKSGNATTADGNDVVNFVTNTGFFGESPSLAVDRANGLHISPFRGYLAITPLPRSIGFWIAPVVIEGCQLALVGILLRVTP